MDFPTLSSGWWRSLRRLVNILRLLQLDIVLPAIVVRILPVVTLRLPIARWRRRIVRVVVLRLVVCVVGSSAVVLCRCVAGRRAS